MAFYSTSEFKPGMKVLLEGAPCAIVENEFVKPGKGQAFNRVRLRNLKNGRMWERTFKSGESLEGADVMDIDMEYLYTDGEFWHFMKTDGSFEQLAAGADVLGDSKDWLKEARQLHRHVVERRADRGDAAELHHPRSRSKPIPASKATPPPEARNRRRSRPAPSSRFRSSYLLATC